MMTPLELVAARDVSEKDRSLARWHRCESCKKMVNPAWRKLGAVLCADCISATEPPYVFAAV